MSKEPSASKHPSDILLSEWTEARGVLKNFDDKLHELRKYGFTLITGLLALQGLLLPFVPTIPGVEEIAGVTAPSAPAGSSVSIADSISIIDYISLLVRVGSGTSITVLTGPAESPVPKPAAPDFTKMGLPYPVKVGILAATLVLVISLKWLDGNYQGLQRGAALRAKVIERLLNLELTEAIGIRYEAEKGQRQIRMLYFGFEAAIIILAILLLPAFGNGELNIEKIDGSSEVLVLALMVSAIGEAIAYFSIISPDRKRGHLPTEWALDKIVVKKGDQVRIITTNIRRRDWKGDDLRRLEGGQKLWDILDYRLNSVITFMNYHPGVMRKTVNLEPGQSYVWTWTVGDEPAGIYHVCVDMDKQGSLLVGMDREKRTTAYKILKKISERLRMKGKIRALEYGWWKLTLQDKHVEYHTIEDDYRSRDDGQQSGGVCETCAGRLLSRSIQIISDKP